MDYMDWNNFFEYLTSAAAAILGLSFVAFSLSPGYWRQTGLRHMAAVVSLIELAIPLFFGLIYLPPGHHWIAGGRLVGSMGYLTVIAQLTVANWYRSRQPEAFEVADKLQIYVGVPMIITTFSILLWWPSLTVKAFTCIWLILSGLTESWVSLHLPAITSDRGTGDARDGKAAV